MIPNKNNMIPNKTSYISRIYGSFLIMGLLLTGIFSATDAVADEDIVTTYKLPTAIVWEPKIAYTSVSLTVSGPDGTVTTQIFNANDEPSFEPSGDANGRYKYELRFQTVAQAGSRDDSGQDGFEPTVEAPVASGVFSIVSGNIVGDDSAGIEVTDDAVSPKDVVTNDDAIIKGNLCVGIDCVDGEAFGFDTLRFKENNLRITFIDTSSSSSFPENDWQITINDTVQGGAEKFSIDDITSGKTPFTIEAGARTNSLFIESTGNIGIGTSNPVVDIHTVTGNTPTLRLDQDGAFGFTPQTWDIAGNEANFFIRDVTNGSTLPFRIFPGAPSSSLAIEGTGHVGLGTANPNARLHVKTSDVNETNLARFENSNGGNPDVNITLVSGTNEWSIGVEGASNRMIFSKGDFPALSIDPKTLRLTASGGIVSKGTIMHASDRDLKTDFKTANAELVLNKVVQMPISSWRFKTEDTLVRHLGPTSQDFKAAFDLGDGSDHYINIVDADGVALVAIQGLNQKLLKSLAVRDAVIEDMQLRIEALENASK